MVQYALRPPFVPTSAQRSQMALSSRVIHY
jgi:hypothetical protein